MTPYEMSAKLAIARTAFMTGDPVIIGIHAHTPDGMQGLEVPLVLHYPEIADLMIRNDFNIDAAIADIGTRLINGMIARGYMDGVPPDTCWHGFVSPMMGIN